MDGAGGGTEGHSPIPALAPRGFPILALACSLPPDNAHPESICTTTNAIDSLAIFTILFSFVVNTVSEKTESHGVQPFKLYYNNNHLKHSSSIRNA